MMKSILKFLDPSKAQKSKYFKQWKNNTFSLNNKTHSWQTKNYKMVKNSFLAQVTFEDYIFQEV